MPWDACCIFVYLPILSSVSLPPFRIQLILTVIFVHFFVDCMCLHLDTIMPVVSCLWWSYCWPEGFYAVFLVVVFFVCFYYYLMFKQQRLYEMCPGWRQMMWFNQETYSHTASCNAHPTDRVHTQHVYTLLLIHLKSGCDSEALDEILLLFITVHYIDCSLYYRVVIRETLPNTDNTYFEKRKNAPLLPAVARIVRMLTISALPTLLTRKS